MRAPRKVSLSDERDGRTFRSVTAELMESGDLRIDGHDLGPDVEKFWGQGLTEYEWTLTIREKDLGKALLTLGGSPGEDVLELLADHYKHGRSWDTTEVWEEHGVPAEFWNRVGS